MTLKVYTFSGKNFRQLTNIFPRRIFFPDEYFSPTNIFPYPFIIRTHKCGGFALLPVCTFTPKVQVTSHCGIWFLKDVHACYEPKTMINEFFLCWMVLVFYKRREWNKIVTCNQPFVCHFRRGKWRKFEIFRQGKLTKCLVIDEINRKL